jgi:hypothetical protein
MSQSKAGLQKGVSEIFSGMSPQKNGGDTNSAKADGAPAQENRDNNATKPTVPSHMTPTKSKTDQPSQQKQSMPKQPKADAATKTIEKVLKSKTVQDIKNKLFASKNGVSSGRQKATVILAPILFIVLIVLFIRAFSGPSGPAVKPKPSGPIKTAAAANNDADRETTWKAPQPYPTTLRDPMQFGSAMSEAGGLVIKGIVYSKDSPTAIIGNNIVHEGDKILDVTVVKINEDSVEFEANNKKWMQQVQR